MSGIVECEATRSGRIKKGRIQKTLHNKIFQEYVEVCVERVERKTRKNPVDEADAGR